MNWISFSDELPKEQQLIVYVSELGGFGVIEFVESYHKHWTWKYWMPLAPLPNKEQGVQVSDTTMLNQGDCLCNQKNTPIEGLQGTIDWEGLDKAVKKMEWYAWDKKGMIAYKKGVPIEDVFILRQDVLDLLAQNKSTKLH